MGPSLTACSLACTVRTQYLASLLLMPPENAKNIDRWHHQTDLLVVGFGCAGAAAALEAEAAGARVTLLDKASGAGGTTANSGGVIYLGGGTPLQTDCGFEDSPEEMFKYLMASCGPAPDEDRVRAYSEGSVEHYHWFLERGVPFKAVYYPHYSGEPPTDDGLVFSGSEEAWPYNTIARPAPRGHVPQAPHQAGPLLMQKLEAAVTATSVEVLTDTRCQRLVLDEGRVVGAVASRDGRDFVVRADRGVVLATGGFIENKEMVRTHAPLLQKCKYRVGAGGDDGSGIRMGAEAGGATCNMSYGSVSLPIIPPKSLLKGIMVDEQGQRFINEDVYYGLLGAAALYKAKGRAYLILDGDTYEPPEVERELAGVGEDAAELERKLGMAPGALEGTLEQYNRYAVDGQDPAFHKAAGYVVPLRAPYAALDCTTENSLYAVFTLGGLWTDTGGGVLDPDGQRVPGLWAAGRASAALSAPGYSSGLSIGDGTFFGRRAGREAAASK